VQNASVADDIVLGTVLPWAEVKRVHRTHNGFCREYARIGILS